MPSVTPTIRAVGLSARQMFDKLKYGLDPSGVSLPSDHEHLRPELLHLADGILSASQRHYVLDWDSATYYDATKGQNGGNQDREKEFQEQFRTLDTGGTVRDPCTLVDMEGHIEVIYVPGAIGHVRQADICHLVQHVRPCLERNGPKPGDIESPHGWRQKEAYFRQDCPVFGAGLFTASPGYQSQGHQMKKEKITPSRDLATVGKRPSRTQTLLQDWVVAMEDCALILSAALAITHPEQFELSLRCLDEIYKQGHLRSVAELWAFAFSAVSVISNRATPEHRDQGSGGRGFLDLLLSLGGCRRTALELPGLGMRFGYESGTLVLFSGHVHLHAVTRSEQERFCIAGYARKEVHHKYGIKLPSPVEIGSLLSINHRYLK